MKSRWLYIALQVVVSFGIVTVLGVGSAACDGGGVSDEDGQNVSDFLVGADADASSVIPAGQFGEIIAHSKVDYAEDIHGSGNLVFVTGKESGLHVFDVSDPKNPVKLATLPMTKAWDVIADGTRAWVTDYSGGLHAVDASDPNNIQVVGTYTNGNEIIALGQMGTDRVVVGGGDGVAKGWFEIIDVTTPTPKLVGNRAVVDVESDGAAASLAAADGFVYFGQADGTLRIFDATNPSNITQVGTYFNQGTLGHEPWGLGITIAGDHLFYSDWGAGVITLDISSPTSPQEVSVFAEGGYAFYDSYFHDERLYIALDGGLGVLDMNNPAQPSLIGGSYLSTKAGAALDDAPHGVWVHNGVAWVSDNKAGMLVGVAVP
ncbi:MAG: hypothetical protein HUU55_08945 [Myxococcales bacterium]|nr:hypothetical protein [Myxococcales bacterium]